MLEVEENEITYVFKIVVIALMLKNFIFIIFKIKLN